MKSITETRHDPTPNRSTVRPSRLPRTDEPSKQTTPVECFVAEMTKNLGLGDQPIDIRCRSILLRLTAWATSEGLPLAREAILDPDTVERFSQIGLANDRL